MKEINWEYTNEWVGTINGLLGEVRIVLAKDSSEECCYCIHTNIPKIPISREIGLERAKGKAQEIVNRHLLSIALT